jgi:hypothetical protein
MNIAMQVSPSLLAGGSEIISRERNEPPEGNGTMGTSRRSSSDASVPGSPRKSSKRPRIDSGMGHGLEGDDAMGDDVQMKTPMSVGNGIKRTKVEAERMSEDTRQEEA